MQFFRYILPFLEETAIKMTDLTANKNNQEAWTIQYEKYI